MIFAAGARAIGRGALSWGVGLALLLLRVPDASAQLSTERQYTEIAGAGQTLYAIAVAPVLAGAGMQREAETATRVLSNDLALSGLFKVLSPRGFLANLGAEGTGIQTGSWVNVGAQAVVKARAERRDGGLELTWYLYDLGKGSQPVVVKRYTGSSTGARYLAHRFGNEIVTYFTREPGVFLTKIAFAAGSQRRGISQIYTMDFDGYGAAQLSRTGTQNLLPAWSPRGQLAYTSLLWRNPDLFVVASRGGGRPQRISRWPGLNSAAAWSPDGSKIALTLSKDGNAEIYVISSSGRVLRRLTNHPAIDTSPTWSPDGSRIAFVSDRAGSPQIYVMSANGGAARRLTFAGNYNQEPEWCPRKDLPLVAFTGRDERGSYDIFTINVANGEIKRLTQGQGSNKSPSWAPNGRLLVFSSSRGGLWLMTAEGLNQQQIYRGDARTPAWSH